MIAKARVRTILIEDGKSRNIELVSDPPLTFRETVDGLKIVNTSAGPIAGDKFSLNVLVEDGAVLHLGTIAATIALPGKADAPASLTDYRFSVGNGSTFSWEAKPLIVSAGANHHQILDFDLAQDSNFVAFDSIVLGRHNEEPGELRQDIRVRVAGRQVLEQSLLLNEKLPWRDAALMQGNRTLVSVLVRGNIRLPDLTSFEKFEMANGFTLYQSFNEPKERLNFAESRINSSRT